MIKRYWLPLTLSILVSSAIIIPAYIAFSKIAIALTPLSLIAAFFVSNSLMKKNDEKISLLKEENQLKKELLETEKRKVDELEEARKLEEDRLMKEVMDTQAMMELEQERIMLQVKQPVYCNCREPHVQLVVIDHSLPYVDYVCEKTGDKYTAKLVIPQGAKKTEIK